VAAEAMLNIKTAGLTSRVALTIAFERHKGSNEDWVEEGTKDPGKSTGD